MPQFNAVNTTFALRLAMIVAHLRLTLLKGRLHGRNESDVIDKRVLELLVLHLRLLGAEHGQGVGCVPDLGKGRAEGVGLRVTEESEGETELVKPVGCLLALTDKGLGVLDNCLHLVFKSVDIDRDLSELLIVLSLDQVLAEAGLGLIEPLHHPALGSLGRRGGGLGGLGDAEGSVVGGEEGGEGGGCDELRVDRHTLEEAVEHSKSQVTSETRGGIGAELV